MRTKALVWIARPNVPLLRSHSLLGLYRVWVASKDGEWNWSFEGYDGSEECGIGSTEELCIAAAQSHFDAAIASVLEDDRQTMETAPKDGTRIWVAEVTPEYTNMMEARWCRLYGPNDRDAPTTDGLMTSWWGLTWRVGDSQWPGVAGRKELSPFGRADNSALSPTHWRHLPSPPKAGE